MAEAKARTAEVKGSDGKPDHFLTANIAQKPTRTNVIVVSSFQAFQRE
jgi:hypothetical protein